MDLVASWPLLLSLVAGGTGVVYVAIHIGTQWKRNQRLQQLVDQNELNRVKNRQRLREKLDQENNGSSKLRQTLLKMPFEKLRAVLLSGDVKPIVVLRAYQEKALQVTEDLNCITNFFEDADRWAADLEGKERKDLPLYGIPVSLKECYPVKGHDSTIGLAQLLEHPCPENCAAVSILLSLGAIPFCHTNTSHATATHECANPVFGQTLNPSKSDRDPGGSSGGEAALLAGGGSILGVGNDIGGSLRNPAALCGVFSLRPSLGRHVSQRGVRYPGLTNSVALSPLGGFMARDVGAIRAGCKAAWSREDHPEDYALIRIPWREEVFDKRKLKVGFTTNCGSFRSHPACDRAVQEAVNNLRAAGHSVVAFDPWPFSYDDVISLSLGMVTSDKGTNFARCLSADLPHASTAAILAAGKVMRAPAWVNWIVAKLFGLLTKMKMPVPKSTGDEIVQGMRQKDELLNDLMDRMNAMSIDAIVMPASVVPAPKLGTHSAIPTASSPYIPWSLFDLPAGVTPVTKVTQKDEDAFFGPDFPDDDMVYRQMKAAAADAIGLPVGVQVIGRRFQEELILRVMEAVHK